MRILLTNEDGIQSPGLEVLEKIGSDLTEDGWVVAPEIDNSGASHSLTLAEPLRLRELGTRHYGVKGTPTDCVRSWGCVYRQSHSAMKSVVIWARTVVRTKCMLS
jgi:5'/3'-nucleotidase SurE